MSRLGHLVVIRRSGVDGAHFPLRRKACLFGRGIECDIRIQLPVVSKQHCKIEVTQQEAILSNFSNTSPTQLNGAAVYEPVKLKHGDIITIVDRSFRFECESHQKGIETIEFPERRSDKESPRRFSRSSFSHNSDGKDQDPKARSKFTEEEILGRSLVPSKNVKDDGASDGSEDPFTRKTPQAANRDCSSHYSKYADDNDRKATDPTVADFKEDVSGVTLISNQELKSRQYLESSEKNYSPFRKLYGSMKEELDVKLQKENVAQGHRRSGTQTPVSGKENERQGERPPESRLKSRRRSQKARPAAHVRESTQMEEKGTPVEPGQISREAPNSSVPLAEMTKMKTPVQCSQPQNSSRKRKSEELGIIGGGLSVNFEKNEGSQAKSLTRTPSNLITRGQAPVKVAGAIDSGKSPRKLSSRKEASIPTCVEVLPQSAEADLQGQASLAKLLAPVEREVQNDALGKPGNLNAKVGPINTGPPNISSSDVSDYVDSISYSNDNKSEEMSLKRRRVSFGGHLKPELFDENLPPNTPLKRGETPGKRRSLGTQAPTVLKKIIKVQPKTPGKEASSEISLEMNSAQNMFLSSSAFKAKTVSPAANDQSPTSSKASSGSSGRSPPPQRSTPKRGGRKSGSLSLKRRSLDKSRHDTLQMIYSKRQSGASEANLIVARSWADVVKLGAKKPQTKVVKQSHQRRIRRKQRTNTPQKPENIEKYLEYSNIQNQFSTGHANSPCTIVIGKAHIEKISAPAWPCRMYNTFVLNRRNYSGFSGLREMFKTPDKEKPQGINRHPDTAAYSKILIGKEFQVTNSGEEPLLCTLENFEENVLSNTQNVTKEPSDESSASLLVKTPEAHITTNIGMKTPESEVEPLVVTSRADAFRRSPELGNLQVLCAEMKNEKETTNIAENNLGLKTPRRTPAKEKNLDGKVKKSERPVKTAKKNAESKENSEKATPITRLRRTLEQKSVPVEDLIAIQRLLTSNQVKEQVEDLTGIKEPMGTLKQAVEPIIHDNVDRKLQKTPAQSRAGQVASPAGIQGLESIPKDKAEPVEDQTLIREVLQTPEQSEAPLNDDEITKDLCKSPQHKPDPVDTPTGIERLFQTPQEQAEKPLAFRRLIETPKLTKEPISDDKGLKIVKETPEQILDPEENLTDSKRLLKSSKEKAQPVEDLVLVEEQPQTPQEAEQRVSGDGVHRKLRNTPKRKRGLREHLILLKELVRKPEEKADPMEELEGISEAPETSKQREEQSHREIRNTTKQKPESAASPVGFNRLPRTPKIKPECVGDQKKSPEHQLGSADKLWILTRVLRTPKVKPEPVGDLADVTVFPQALQQPEEPMSGDSVHGKLRNTPKHKPEPGESRAGVKSLSRTPKIKPESLGDVTVFPHTLKEPEEPIDGDNVHRKLRTTPRHKPELMEHLAILGRMLATHKKNAHFVEEDLQTLKQAVLPVTPWHKCRKSENLTGLKILFGTPEEKAELVDDPAGSEESKTSQQIMESGDRTINELETPSKEKNESAELLTDIKKPLRTSLKKEPIEDLPGLKRPMQSPKAKGDQEEDLTGVSNRMRTPKWRWESVENLTSMKRFMKTPTKVHPIEDVILLTATPNKVTEDVSGTPTVLKTYAQEALSTNSNISEKLQEIQLPKTPEIKDVKNPAQENQVIGKILEHPQSVHTSQSKETMGDLTELLETPKEHLEPRITSDLNSKKPATRKKSTVEDFSGLQRLMAEPKQKIPCLEIDYTGFEEMLDLGNKNQDGPGELCQENSSCNPPDDESKPGASETEELLPEKTQGRIVSQRTRSALRKKSARKSPAPKHLPSQTENVLAETNAKVEFHLQDKPSRGMSLRSRHRYKTDTELQGSQSLTSAEKIQTNKGEKTVKIFQEENSEDGEMKQKTVTLRSRGKSKPGIRLQESDRLASLTEVLHVENNDKPMKSLQDKVKSINEEKMPLRAKKRIKTTFEEEIHPKTVMFMNNVQVKKLEDMEINQEKVLVSSRSQSKKGVKFEGSNHLSDKTKVADEEAEDKITDSSAVKILNSTGGTQGIVTSRSSRSRSKRNVKSEVFPSLPSTPEIPPTEEIEEEPVRKTQKNVKDTAVVTPGPSLRLRGSRKVFPTDLLSGTTNRMSVSKDEGKPEQNPKEERARSSRSGSGQKYTDPQSSLSTAEVTDLEEVDKPTGKTLGKPKERAVKPEATSLRTRYQTRFLQHSDSLSVISEKIPTEQGEKERRLVKHKTQTQDGRSTRSKSKANTDSEGFLNISSETEIPHTEETTKVLVKSQKQQEAAASEEVRLRSSSQNKIHLPAKVQESLPARAEQASWEKDKAAGLQSCRLRKTNTDTPPSEVIQMGDPEDNPMKKIQARKPEDPEMVVNRLCLRSRKVKILATEMTNKGITLKNAVVSKVETSPKGRRHNQRATRSAKRCVAEEAVTGNSKQEKNIETKKMKTRKDIEDV